MSRPHMHRLGGLGKGHKGVRPFIGNVSRNTRGGHHVGLITRRSRKKQRLDSSGKGGRKQTERGPLRKMGEGLQEMLQELARGGGENELLYGNMDGRDDEKTRSDRPSVCRIPTSQKEAKQNFWDWPGKKGQEVGGDPKNQERKNKTRTSSIDRLECRAIH